MNTYHTHLSDDVLNAWIDGVATPDERVAVGDHIRACTPCADRLRELQAVKAMLSELGDVAPPRSFRLTAEQARTPVSLESRRPSAIVRLQPVVRALSIAAILTVMILGGTLFYSQQGVQDGGDQTITATSETNSGDQTSGTSNSSKHQAGTVKDRGQSASNDTGAGRLTNLGNGEQTDQTVDADGLSPLAIATITVGALALVLTLTWIVMSRSSGAFR